MQTVDCQLPVRQCGLDGDRTHCGYESSAVHDQFRHKAMRIARHEIKPSPKDQVTHNIVVQIRGPLRHIKRLRPVFAVLATLENDILESLHILDQIHLRRSQGFLRECVLHHAPMSCVDASIRLGMDAVCTSC
jgi:hypothetical protein